MTTSGSELPSIHWPAAQGILQLETTATETAQQQQHARLQCVTSFHLRTKPAHTWNWQ